MKYPAALFVLPLVLLACAEQIPDHVELLPQGENVEFALEPPGPGAYKLVGEVSGLAAANDPDVAQQAAKNDLRNKAAALGATLVTVDLNLGEPMPLQDKTKVKVTGRAYKSVD
jgi:Domain of unknown function (DUF4156)